MSASSHIEGVCARSFKDYQIIDDEKGANEENKETMDNEIFKLSHEIKADKMIQKTMGNENENIKNIKVIERSRTSSRQISTWTRTSTGKISMRCRTFVETAMSEEMVERAMNKKVAEKMTTEVIEIIE